MPCYHPLTGYYAREVNDTGKRSLVFSVDKALVDVPVQVPCGRCIGCRLDRSLSWAVRCVHEASLYDENCFITLTFDDKHLGDGSLHVSDFQNFMKRFRQFVAPRKIRFFHCGEYGAQFSRPHHHACIFNYDFPDKKAFGKEIFTSDILSQLWPYGFSTVGRVTMQSAAYVARYVLKKWSKDNLEGQELYDAMQALSNEDAKKLFYGGKHPEYVTMSRRPGIGDKWFSQFSSELFPSGFVVLPSGKKCRIPKFYDSKFELDNLIGMAKIKGERCRRAQENPDNTRERLQVRGEVKLLNSKQLIRGYEDGR